MRWLRILRLPELLEQFQAHMVSQLDLTKEAHNLEEFRRNFGRRKSRRDAGEIAFPAPLAVLPAGRAGGVGDGAKWVAAKGGVLVESREEGVGLDRWLVKESDALRSRAGKRRRDPAAEEAARERREKIAINAATAFFQMVLLDNFVHADLHPGNILLREPKRKGRADAEQPTAIVFLDAGLVVRLSERDKRNFADLFLAVAKGEGKRAGQLIVSRSPGGREGVRRNGGDPDRFVRAIAAVVEEVAAKKFQLGAVAIGPVLLDVLSAVREDCVPLEPAFGNLVSAIIVLEGIGRQLHPDLDLFALAVPMLVKQAARRVAGRG